MTPSCYAGGVSTAPTKGTRSATEADLLALPDGGRGWELIDGALTEKETGARHGQAQVSLVQLVGPFRRRGGGDDDTPHGWHILTEQLVRLVPHTVRPDVAGWRRKRLPELPSLGDDGVLDLRPDWVCEIISPKHAADDLVRKRRIYWQHEVPHYWIVDPRDETLTVHRWNAAGYIGVLVAQREERVRAEPFEAVEMRVGALFGDDEDAT